jgi:ubiquitin carboxyl-terminal hydrolase L3
MDSEQDNWLPLESNPEVFNTTLGKLGFDPSVLVFQDVYGTEDWAFAMVGTPVVGVLFCFGMGEHHKKANLPDPTPKDQIPEDLFYMHQISGNACGMVGLYHIVGNIEPEVQKNYMKEDGILGRFFAKAKGQSYPDLAKAFDSDKELRDAHGTSVQMGQSEVQSKVNNHFVAFVHQDGGLFELDGRKSGPIRYGSTTPETLLADACAVIKTEYMEKDPENPNMAIMAMAGAPPS